MAFPRFLTVSVSMVVDGPALVVGSALCRCDPGTHHKYGVDVFGVAGNCPIKIMLGQADKMVDSFPGGHGQIKTEWTKDSIEGNSGTVTITFNQR